MSARGLKGRHRFRLYGAVFGVIHDLVGGGLVVMVVAWVVVDGCGYEKVLSVCFKRASFAEAPETLLRAKKKMLRKKKIGTTRFVFRVGEITKNPQSPPRGDDRRPYEARLQRGGALRRAHARSLIPPCGGLLASDHLSRPQCDTAAFGCALWERGKHIAYW